MAYDPQRITFFAKTDARGADVPFGIKAIDRTRHMYVIGKTGMGKSTLLENMAVQDIKNGEGIAFIDPHGATAETLLNYIPEERKGDVLYFAPFDTQYPIAFNVMEDVGPERRHLVVSGLMSVFKKIFVDAWSARMEYILTNTILALLEYPDSTLLGVNRMLSDKKYRKRVVDNIKDPAVRSFWVDEFANYNERYMQEAGDAIKNKIGQFTANPIIRNIIGQPKSSFDIRKMMDEQKIIIMNLSKGLVGESNANLLGSMLTTRIYLAAMSRADMSQEKMRVAPNFYFYVDEFQSFANATFADILSEARKYKLNLTIAHQYIEQMEEDVRNAVFGNVGTIAAFRVGPFDAEVLETIFSPQFLAVDICNLGFAQIYLTLMIDGIGSPPFSAQTLPPIEPPSTSCKDMVIHHSRQQFGRERAAVDAAINAWHQDSHELEMESRRSTSPKQTTSPVQDRRNNSYEPRERRPDSNRDEAKSKNWREDKKPDKPKRPPQNETTVEDLRTVLSGLVKNEKASAAPEPKDIQTNEKDVVKEVRAEVSQKNKLPPPHSNGERAENHTPTKQFEKKVDATVRSEKTEKDPKASLAAVLKRLSAEGGQMDSTKSQKQNEDKAAAHEAPIKNTQVESRQQAAVASKPTLEQSSSPINYADQSRDAGVSVADYTASEFVPPPAQKTPSPVQKPARTRSSEIDPKHLERMMRVKTSDKTPFK